MNCIECNGSGYAWYGNRTTYAVCEICGGVGTLNDQGLKHVWAPETPLWPQHDQAALERDRRKLWER